MTPVDQLIFERGKGDCLRACVASILDKDIEEIPNFAEHGFDCGLMTWLKTQGFIMLKISWTGGGFDHNEFIDSTEIPFYCIFSGLSPRWVPNDEGPRLHHAVVGHFNGWGFKIDHDPHSSRAGIVGNPSSATWIFKSI